MTLVLFRGVKKHLSVFPAKSQGVWKSILGIARRYGISFFLVLIVLLFFTPYNPGVSPNLTLVGLTIAITTSALFFGLLPGLATTMFASLTLYLIQDAASAIESYSLIQQSYVIALYGGALSFLISVRTRHMYEIERQGEHFRALAEQSHYPIVLKDSKGKVLFASESIADLLDVEARNLLGKDLVEFVHPDDKRKFRSFYAKVFKTPAEKRSVELRMRGVDGRWVWMRNDVVNLLHEPSINAAVAGFQDISRQKELDEQRVKSLERERKARAEAEKAVRTRDEFLSVASHELKTPLTTILLQLQGTIRRILTQSLANFSGEQLVKSLTTAEQQSQRLSIMIKDLLSVSLISTGRIRLEKQEGDLAELVQSLVERFSEETRTPITMERKEAVSGSWDMIRIEQILTNLLTNAIKYGEGKPIDISVWKKDKKALISVADQGIGVPRREQERIFELFRRGKNNAERGLGVGLFISRQIARAHGGDITIESQKGKGSTFVLSLPLTPSH